MSTILRICYLRNSRLDRFGLILVLHLGEILLFKMLPCPTEQKAILFSQPINSDSDLTARYNRYTAGGSSDREMQRQHW